MPMQFRGFPIPIFMPGEDAVWLPGGEKKLATLCKVKDFVNDDKGEIKGYKIIPKSGRAKGILTLTALDELTTIPKKPPS